MAPAIHSPAFEGTLVERLVAALDRDDPVPLYHQVASVLRWEIGMGRAAVGEALPPIRFLSEALGLNYQTVRRAYASLAEEGVVEPRRGSGTVVRKPPARGMWSPSPAASGDAGDPRVFVVECNLTQAASLARQVRERYDLAAIPWLLEGYGEPPPGLILGSSFHELDMRRRWPHRRGHMHAVRLELDPEAAGTIRRIVEILGLRKLMFVERDRATAESLSAELCRSLYGFSFEVVNAVAADPAGIFEGEVDAMVVYAPRVWDALPWTVQSHPRAVTLPFPFAHAALDELASHLGWTPRDDE